MAYESPELDIRWFETEDVCSNSLIIDPTPGDSGSGGDIFGGDDGEDWGDDW